MRTAQRSGLWALLVWLWCSIGAQAQTTVFSQDWTSTTPGWTFTGTGTKNWQRKVDGGTGNSPSLWTELVVSGNGAYSPGFTLNAGTTYTLTWKLRCNNATGRQIWAAVNTAAAQNGNQQIVRYVPVSPTTQTTYTNTFTVPASGTYYLMYYQLHNGSNSGSYINIYIDDIAITFTNASPTVALTAPSNGAVLLAGSSQTLTADASDSDGTISKVEFFQNGTKIGEDLSSPYSLNFTAANGSNSLYAVATDNGGASSTSATRTITGNQAPATSLTSPSSGSIALTGSAGTLTASASDADGTISKVEFFQNGSKIGEDLTSPYSLGYTLAGGANVFYAVATDNSGFTGISATVTVTGNTPPTVSLTSPANGAVFVMGSPISMEASASDADGSVASVKFYQNGALVGEDFTSPYQVSVSPVLGTNTLYAEATDNHGAVTASGSVVVTGNSAPTVSFTAPADGSVLPQGNVTLEVTASDAGGSVNKVQFYQDSVLLGEDFSSPYSYVWAATSGVYQVKAIAVDNLGTSSETAVLDLTINQAPTVSLVVPLAGATGSVGNITLRASAADADGTVNRVRFFVDGVLAGEDSIAPFTWTRYFGAGTYNVYAQAMDNRQFTTNSATNSISVSAAAPQLLYNENFNSGLNGFFVPFGSALLWRHFTGTGGMNNTPCLLNKTATNTADFVSSPLVSLSATKEYNAFFYARSSNANSNRPLVVSLNTTRSRTGAVEVGRVILNTTTYVPYTLRFSPETDGNYYVIYWTEGTGYTDVFVDSVRLETNAIPSVSFSAPANNAVINEGSPIVLDAAASDADGTISKVEFYANGVKIGEDLSSPYSYTWSNYLPGTKAMTAVATDNRGNRSPAASLNLDIRFSNGTISDYAHYDFQTGIAPWTAAAGAQVGIRNGYNGTQGFWIHYSTTGSFIHSPRLYLFAGVTYSFEMRVDGNSTTNHNVLFGYNSTPDFPTKTTVGSPWVINLNTNFAKNTWTFTVPADGAYHLMAWTTNTGYVQIYMDEFRLIGDLNEGALVNITSPANNTVIAQGSALSINATATDPDGVVNSVRFEANGQSVATDASAPYVGTTTNLTSGSYALQAIATDDRNGEGYSPLVNVTIDPSRVSTASFLGGTGADDAVRGAVIQPDSTVVLAAFLGNASPGNVSPVLLNNSTSTTRGAIVRLSKDGKTVLSVTRLAQSVVDLSQDSVGNLYVAAGPAGVFKLNPQANAILWNRTFAKNVYRVDAGKAGYAALMTAPGEFYENFDITGASIEVLDPAGSTLSSTAGPSQYSHDVAIHEQSQTVVSIGTKNFSTPSFTGAPSLPVFVPSIVARAYNGTQKYRLYDWESDQNSPRWLNKPENNMADVRGERISIGEDGNMYVLYEVAGGNHCLRYSPFDIMTPAPIVGGDNYFTFSNTNDEHKLFVGKYAPATGQYLLGQQFCGRLSNGAGNTVSTQRGNVAADRLGRAYVTGSAASGLPINLEYLAGQGTSGAFLLVLSPDFATRDLCTRFHTTSGLGRVVAVRGSQMVLGGSTAQASGFTFDALQPAMSGTADGFFVVGSYDGFFSYRPGIHPRLFFSAADVPALQAKSSQQPFATIQSQLVASLTLNEFGNGPIDTLDVYDMSVKAQNLGFLYVLTGNETYALEARKCVNFLFNQTGFPWGSSAVKGLTSYFMGSSVAKVYDWCAGSPNWDDLWKYTISFRLRQMADMVNSNGGTEQATDQASNWQASRGASAGLMYLAMDHTLNATNLNSSHSRVTNYINSNLGSGTGSKGWNLEGLGYTFYPWGYMVGPYGIAMGRYDNARDIRNTASVRWMHWSGYAVVSNALDVSNFGGFRPDFSDDNPHMAGEGFFGQAFYYGLPQHISGMKYWYNRTQGAQAPFGPYYDRTRSGGIWSYLYYPADTTEVNPAGNTAWREGYVDNTGGNGFFTYRNNFLNGDDHIAQFRAKTRNSGGGHDGPDGLTYRIIGAGTPWVVGGGRNTPGNYNLQPALYPVSPGGTSFTVNRNTGTVVGTPVSFPNGGGHVIASMSTDNLNVGTHKRWFVSNFAQAATGADAVYIIADQSTNGLFNQLSLFDGLGTPTFNGNTFSVTAANGATMQGTVLYPGSNYRFATGTKARGSNFGTYANNKFITCQSDDGEYILVLTIRKTGAHPTVSFSGSSAIVGSVITVGSATFTLQNDQVVYGGGAGRMAVSEARSLPGIALWPNPAKEGRSFVQLMQDDNQTSTVLVRDALGREILRQEVQGNQVHTLDLQGQGKGLYWVTVEQNGRRQTHKLMVE